MTFDVIMLLFLVATRKVPRGRAGCDPFPFQGGEHMSSWKHLCSALVLMSIIFELFMNYRSSDDLCIVVDELSSSFLFRILQ